MNSIFKQNCISENKYHDLIQYLFVDHNSLTGNTILKYHTWDWKKHKLAFSEDINEDKRNWFYFETFKEAYNYFQTR